LGTRSTDDNQTWAELSTGGSATESHEGLFTQYVTGDMEAVQLNWRLTDAERVIPRSHGCLGLAYDDAAFAWDFLGGGSLVSVHS